MKNVSSFGLIAAFICICAVANAQSPFTFTNANAKFASTNFHSGNSVSVVDMNGDGLDDIARLDQSRDLYYTLQRTNQTFNNIHGVSTSTNSNAWAMVVGDINNDGVRDVAVGYNGSAKVVIPNTALTNFPLVTLNSSNFFLQNMNFGDVDNNGWIDLFGCNDNAGSRFWGNTSGTLLDTTNFFSIANPGTDNSGNYGSIWTDIDNDGDQDFYIAHCRQGTNATDGRRLDQLFINNGNMQFTLDAAAVPGARGLRNYGMTWTSSFEDIDNDGDLDCLLTETDVASQLFLNDGNGYFTEITNSSGFAIDVTPYQSKMEDLDNDGYVDIIISGDDSRVFHNNHDNTFTQVNALFDNNNMLSFATGDLNHDGKVDLYSTYGSVYNSPTTTPDVLWMNTTNNGNHFVTFNLQGTISNRDALGARVEVYGSWGKQIREVRAGESYGTTNSFMCHFGLGTATMLDSAIIRWPKGAVTRLYNRPADQFITVIENQCSSPDNLVSFSGPSSLCAGQSVTMNAPAGYNYLWSTGATTQSITVATEGEYTVRITDSNTGCSSISKMATILQSPDETPTITAASATVFCEGSSVVLHGSAATSYNWSSGETTQDITVNQAGTYTLTIQGSCAQFTSAPIVVSPIASHVTAATPASECVSGATGLDLTAVVSGAPYWYDAPTGGNLVGIGETFTTPPFSDTSITYYVESHDSLFGVSAYVGPADSSIGAGGNFNSNQAEIFDVYKASILRKVTIFSGAYGARTIELRTSGGTVLQSSIDTLNIGVNVVTLNFPMNPGTGYRLGVSGTNINMYRNSSGGSYPYTVNNLVSITGNTANDNARWYFFYHWQVEEQPTACASNRTPVNATARPLPDATVTSNHATTICTGEDVTLSAPAGYTYLWSNNATTQDITVNTSGSYTVTVTTQYCSAESAGTTVTVSNNPVASVTPSAATSFCQGGSVDLSASSGTNYLWSNGETTQSITVNATGTFTVTVTISGSCSAVSNPTTVTVNPLPTVSFSGLGAQYHNNDAAVTLTGSPSGGTFSGTGVTGDSFDPAAAGVGGPYTITYSYTDNNGCSATSTSDVTVLLASGINNLSALMKVSVYPNPGNGQFILSLTSGNSVKADVVVSNNLGQKVYEERSIAVVNTVTKDVNLQNLAKGIYNLTIYSGKETANYKLVIQ